MRVRNAVAQVLQRVAVADVFNDLLKELSDLDLSIVYVDGIVVKVHQHGTGAWRGERAAKESAIRQNRGKTSGVWDTLALFAVDRYGMPITSSLHPGNRNEGPVLADLIEGLDIGEVVADKAYDSRSVRRCKTAESFAAFLQLAAWMVDARKRRRKL